ncbi:hypothetical protein CPB83DRAFT_864648 [Crepidotus variabilis]|uniref:Uncharacterized protein n=1 Tax=Crepidotus variabilis TaxID=179855 RepID=A0A9P6E4B1_9AGAR|nr:hypothetical protein CPB83DRAFT_864648 [Crepidotus variabilis]
MSNKEDSNTQASTGTAPSLGAYEKLLIPTRKQPTDEIILKKGASMDKVLSEVGLDRSGIPHVRILAFGFAGTFKPEMLEKLRAHPDVECVEDISNFSVILC